MSVILLTANQQQGIQWHALHARLCWRVVTGVVRRLGGEGNVDVKSTKAFTSNEQHKGGRDRENNSKPTSIKRPAIILRKQEKEIVTAVKLISQNRKSSSSSVGYKAYANRHEMLDNGQRQLVEVKNNSMKPSHLVRHPPPLLPPSSPLQHLHYHESYWVWLNRILSLSEVFARILGDQIKGLSLHSHTAECWASAIWKMGTQLQIVSSRRYGHCLAARITNSR